MPEGGLIKLARRNAWVGKTETVDFEPSKVYLAADWVVQRWRPGSPIEATIYRRTSSVIPGLVKTDEVLLNDLIHAIQVKTDGRAVAELTVVDW